MRPIELTPDERQLWDQIHFVRPEAGVDHERLRASLKPAYRLACSLLDREAIPAVRWRWFVDPELHVGGHGKSRKQVFERNGCHGEAILKHPHFLPHLRYFVIGPDLPSSTIDAFTALVKRCVTVTSGDCDEFCDLARAQVRTRGLSPYQSADEFFKLCLELDLDDGFSRIVRDSVVRMKTK